jgi:hypothetical protein
LTGLAAGWTLQLQPYSSRKAFGVVGKDDTETNRVIYEKWTGWLENLVKQSAEIIADFVAKVDANQLEHVITKALLKMWFNQQLADSLNDTSTSMAAADFIFKSGLRRVSYIVPVSIIFVPEVYLACNYVLNTRYIWRCSSLLESRGRPTLAIRPVCNLLPS